MAPPDPPVPLETLHGYVSGDLTPEVEAQVEAQLKVCPESRRRLEQVESVHGLLRTMVPKPLDDLSWERMRRRIQQDLAQPKPQPQKHFLRGLPLGVAAAAILLTVVAVQQRPHQSPRVAPSPQTLNSGSGPLSVTLASGTALTLAPQSKVSIREPGALPTRLKLTMGELDVQNPQRTHQGAPSVVVQTPAYVAKAFSRDFTVAYQAQRYFVESRDGTVRVEGEAFKDGVTIHAGERRVVKTQRPSRVQVLLEASLEKAKKRAATRSPAVKKSSSGQTRVEQVFEDADPVKQRWLQTAQAYYEGRDLPRAIRLAREVVELAPERPEARMAEALLCEAFVATGQAQSAISACQARLARPQTDAERRQIHLMIGRIQHQQIGDCAQAIDHYTKAMVFGGTSLMDDRVRMFRATCGLEVGNLALVRADLAALENRRDQLPNPRELDTLRQRLAERESRDEQ